MFGPPLRDEDAGNPEPVERFDAHCPALDFDAIPKSGPPAETAEDVSAERVVDVFVDVQPELRVDVRHQRQAFPARRRLKPTNPRNQRSLACGNLAP